MWNSGEVGVFTHRTSADMMVENPNIEILLKAWKVPAGTKSKGPAYCEKIHRDIEDGNIKFVWVKCM